MSGAVPPALCLHGVYRDGFTFTLTEAHNYDIHPRHPEASIYSCRRLIGDNAPRKPIPQIT